MLAVREITVAFGKLLAVDGVSFTVGAGEICALIGPNGAGKSTLFNVINGVYRATRGHISVGGISRRAITPRLATGLGIARTFQNIALFRGMSVLDNVLTGRNVRMRGTFLGHAFPLGAAAHEEAAHRAKAEEILEVLQIQAHRHTPVGRLPYGLQKRVELGRALAAEPRLLLLDEPMAGMTAGEKREMSRFILDVNLEYGVAVVLVEHDLGVVMDLCDHVVVLDHGRKIADGVPDAVRADQTVIDAYLGVVHQEAA
jgi:branched-chain amino acid transport system ATP-binding protein